MNPIRRLRQRGRDAANLKGLFENAEKHAVAQGDERVGAEHLMLAAFDMPEDSAARAFAAIGANGADFAAAIAAQHAEALEGLGVPPALEAAERPASRKRFASFDATVEAAVQATYRIHEKQGALCGAHVVAGVCSVEHGVAARSLDTMGVARDALAKAALEIAAASDDDL